MTNKKIGFVGYLGYASDKPIIGGQMSKTRGIYTELVDKYGEDTIIAVDTSNWKTENVRLVRQGWNVVNQCEKIIIMPNKNGIKFILPFFVWFKPLGKYRIAYPVVGGWITELLNKYSYLAKIIKKVDYILPETNTLKKELKQFVDCKIDVMPIFSNREPISLNSIPTDYAKPYPFCTFSRVIPEKGIDEAVEAVAEVNKQEGKLVCTLDVWGPIGTGYEAHYNDLFDRYKEYVTYKGILSESGSLKELSKYYMMLFPTYYSGEGFPTTVCESFMAALPVITTEWRFNNELVADGTTGFLIPVHDRLRLIEKIILSIEKKKIVLEMKKMCLKKSEMFQPDRLLQDLYTWIDEDM